MIKKARCTSKVRLRLTLLLLSPLSVSAQTHPNFSGTWVRVSQSCGSARPGSKPLQLLIEQHEPLLKLTVRSPAKDSMRELVLSYKTTGEELHYKGLDGDDFRSKPHWNGSELVFDILELERGKELNNQETWRLIDNNTRFVMTKKENAEGKHSTCTSIFARNASASTRRWP